jgi:tetratricopeptide (TPR) repeat protein
VQKIKDLPKRKPQPETCVALGRLAEEAANQPGRPPADQQQLREQARKAYQQALDLEPNHVPALAALARLYATAGDYGRAVPAYRKAVKVQPKDAALWYDLGMCHARHKQWEPALVNLRAAVELDPENRQYGNALGFCLARAGCYEESLACFRRSVGEAGAHYNLARMLHHVNQEELSKQHLRLALQAKPDLAPAEQLLAELEGRAAGFDRPAGETAIEQVAEVQPVNN